MKIIYLILELSFIISYKDIFQNWLTYGEKIHINLLSDNSYEFYSKLKINQKINIFISFDTTKYKYTLESLFFYEFTSEDKAVRKASSPITIIEEDNITTLVSVYCAGELKTDYIAFEISPYSNIENAIILATMNIADSTSMIIETNLNEEKIIPFDTFSSQNIYKFSLTTHNNYYGKLELIFDTENYNSNNFNLSHIYEYGYGTKINNRFYLHFTETKQGNKTILTSSHLVSDPYTLSSTFILKPKYTINNIYVLGTVRKSYKNEFKYILSLEYSFNLSSLYPLDKYYFMYPIKKDQTDQIQLKISNITSLDYYSQPVDVYECWSDSFGMCKKIKTQYFKMTKNNYLSIFLESYYKNNNVSITNIVFVFQPLYNFYNVTIVGSIRENDPDSSSTSTVVLVVVIISCIIILIIIIFILYKYYYKKRTSKEINFDKSDSMGDNSLQIQ